MAYIANWLNDHLQAKQADLIVEDTLANLKTRSNLLDKYVPLQIYDSRHFVSYVLKQINVVASIVAYGAELPAIAQGSFTKITASLLKMGGSKIFDEEMQWEIKEAMELAMAKGVAVQDQRDEKGNIIKGVNNTLADLLFGNVASMTRSVVDLLDYLTWQAIQTGQVNYQDPRTGVTVTLDYRDAGGGYDHFPAAKTGGDRWDQYATANGIQDLYLALDTYIDTNGFPPDEIVMSRKLRNDLMQQTSTKNSASSLTVTQVGQVSPDMLSAVINARGLPMITTFDEMTEIEDAQKNAVKTRFLNTNRFAFLVKDMGKKCLGPTLENDGGKGGVFVATREVTKFPPTDALQSVATGVPIFANPKLLMSQIVKDS